MSALLVETYASLVQSMILQRKVSDATSRHIGVSRHDARRFRSMNRPNLKVLDINDSLKQVWWNLHHFLGINSPCLCRNWPSFWSTKSAAVCNVPTFHYGTIPHF